MFSEDIVVAVVVVGDPHRRIRNKIAKYHYCTNKRITGIVMHSHIKVLPSPLTTALNVHTTPVDGVLPARLVCCRTTAAAQHPSLVSDQRPIRFDSAQTAVASRQFLELVSAAAACGHRNYYYYLFRVVGLVCSLYYVDIHLSSLHPPRLRLLHFFVPFIVSLALVTRSAGALHSCTCSIFLLLLQQQGKGPTTTTRDDFIGNRRHPRIKRTTAQH